MIRDERLSRMARNECSPERCDSLFRMADDRIGVAHLDNPGLSFPQDASPT